MNKIKQYNKARSEIESCFIGLCHAHIVMISWLITRASFKTGIVENITYSDLVTLLTVDAAPGRKDSGAPTKQTIRSYLRTIQSQCGDHFKIISDGQSLKIQFPTLPAIYASYFESTEVYTDHNTGSYTPKTFVNIGENAINDEVFNTEEYIEPYTDEYTPASIDTINAPTHAHAKIKPNPTKPNNNTATDEFSNLKQPIADDFYPSQFVIDKALSLGFSKVTDTTELNKFISFNKACGSQWKDYDYVYLRWLERDAEREQALKAAAQPLKPKQMHANSNTHLSNKNTSGRFNHEQHRYADKGHASQQVINAWRDEFDYCEQTNRFNPRGTPISAPVVYIDIDSLGPNV